MKRQLGHVRLEDTADSDVTGASQRLQPAHTESAEAPARAGRRLTVIGWRPRLGAHSAWLALPAVIAFGVIQTAVRYHNYHLGFIGDDWDFLLRRDTLSVDNVLQPHNGHLSAVGILLYRAIFAVVGISTPAPYIALVLLSVAACAVLSYLFVRRELGPWIALIPPLLLMTLGPAAEGLLWPFMFTLFSALAFWLGAMLLLQREEARSDAIGCALLVLGIGSMSIAVALLPATAVALVLWRGWRKALPRAWIVAVPLVLYLAWDAAYHPHFERTPANVPGFIVNSFLATVADLSGGASESSAAVTGVTNAGYTVPLAAVLIAVVCARCLYLRRVPSTTAYMGVGLLLVWVATGLSVEGLSRTPTQSRDQFHNALLLMLALAPLLPRSRLTPGLGLTLVKGVLVAAVVGAIVAANLGRYGNWEKWDAFREEIANAELAALQVARPAVVAPDKWFEQPEGTWEWEPFTPRAYYKAIDEHGSPLRVEKDLERASPTARLTADVVLVNVEGIKVVSGTRIGAVPPRSASGVPLRPAGEGCAVIPAGDASDGFEVLPPPGVLVIRPAAGPPVEIGIARFGDPPTAVELAPAPGRGESQLLPAHDASMVPWRFRLTAHQRVTVCSGTE